MGVPPATRAPRYDYEVRFARAGARRTVRADRTRGEARMASRQVGSIGLRSMGRVIGMSFLADLRRGEGPT